MIRCQLSLALLTKCSFIKKKTTFEIREDTYPRKLNQWRLDRWSYNIELST